MNWRTIYLIIPALLTVLDVAVAIYFGAAVWDAWSGDILARGLLILLGALGATSLANVWVQAGSTLRNSLASAARGQSTVVIPAEARGQGDV